MSPSQASVRPDFPCDIVLISGLSGAGHSTVLRALEDNGFVAIDNLPLKFLNELPSLYEQPLAISIDTRTLDFNTESFLNHLKGLRAQEKRVQFLFLDCEESTLLRRYNQTRRPHPLSGKDLKAALGEEYALLHPLKKVADVVFDTSHSQSEQTIAWVRERFCHYEPRLIVRLMSFSYRKGVPVDADLVFDARFLKNPFYEPELRSLTGRDKPTQNYLEEDPLLGDFLTHAQTLLALSFEGFQKRGRSYVTIAVGCTGGQHRSVFLVERLFQLLHHDKVLLSKEHRELKGVSHPS